MKTGITGLPYSGKTTLFCALTGQEYGSLTHGRDIHMSTIMVPDERLEKLYEMFSPKKITHATMEYFDVAGQAAGQRKTMEPKMLQTLKNAESLIVVLDAFTDGADPRGDFKKLMEEFAFNDLVVITGRVECLEKELRSDKMDEFVFEKKVLKQCRDILEDGGVLRELSLGRDEEKAIRGFQFLSRKPLLIVVNISEKTLTSGSVQDFEKQFADVQNAVCASICAEMEMEIAMLDEEDRPSFLESIGIDEPALGKIIHLSYESLGLISFFTVVGTEEVRAWTAHKGAHAPECAGIIHSDMERGFIRAEVVSYESLVDAGSFKTAREKGLLRVEGKDYVVKDGDVLTIRFSV